MVARIRFKENITDYSGLDFVLDMEPFPTNAARIDQDTLKRWIE
jgi:hypothetical protein